jgi:hypothetical protein
MAALYRNRAHANKRFAALASSHGSAKRELEESDLLKGGEPSAEEKALLESNRLQTS